MASTVVVARTDVVGSTRIRVWARAAGRCVLCATYLIDARWFFRAVTTGEIAHVVGATTGASSPRGASDSSATDRAEESNLLLLCHTCHRRVDDPEFAELYTTPWLLERKASHERRVREVTDFGALRKTTVLRMTANIRQSSSRPTDRQLAEALRSELLTGFGEDTRTGAFEIELPTAQNSSWAWDAGKQEIDRKVELLNAAVAESDTDHVSVFALAPIPLLVYLGAALDDKYEVRLFPRQRRDDVLAWTWPIAGTTPAPSFESEATSAGDDTATDVIVRIDVTGPTKESNVPVDLAGLPTIRLKSQADEYGTSVIDSVEALNNFSDAWLAVLARIEATWPATKTVHVISAIPATAAIQLGRHHMRTAQPNLAIYQLGKTEYEKAVMIA